MSERIFLEQGSPEWLDYRYDHLNASEAGTVMHCNPYQKIVKLREIKKNRNDSFKGNPATDYGTYWEDSAREYVSALLKVDLIPAVFRDGIYSASLDAYGTDGNESVKVEIKCPYKREDSQLWSQLQIEGSWDQVIPEHYVWQIVHQQMVVPTERTYFFAFIPGNGETKDDWRLIECFVTEEQIRKLQSGWEDFLYPKVEAKHINTPEAAALVRQRADLVRAKKDAERRLKDAETKLKQMAGEADTVFPAGLTYVSKERAGSVNTDKMKSDGIDVDAYRNPPTQFMQFVQEKS